MTVALSIDDGVDSAPKLQFQNGVSNLDDVSSQNNRPLNGGTIASSVAETEATKKRKDAGVGFGGSETATMMSTLPLPAWAGFEQRRSWGERLMLPEWDEGDVDDDGEPSGSDHANEEESTATTVGEYRAANGWKGTDLCHSRLSPVRITNYAVIYGTEGNVPNGPNVRGGIGTTLTGIVHFTDRAESHAGFCHGGSMTSVMDDVIGWCGFLVTGKCRPWSGFTAQINVSLRRPISVGSHLKVVAVITEWTNRKVSVSAKLVVPLSPEEAMVNDTDEVVHCTAEGLVIIKKD